ncbi:hypothetical protein ElyMa_006790100 [Elysia marginata]|uniref:Uncharacterized protein n=1 Tax=Elysia marginata TaxID=1093978 RepID=A0AAV4J1D3_9GAST|nr:hypothetical protein ElyMa_006790100 [Elysia marginata]
MDNRIDSSSSHVAVSGARDWSSNEPGVYIQPWHISPSKPSTAEMLEFNIELSEICPSVQGSQISRPDNAGKLGILTGEFLPHRCSLMHARRKTSAGLQSSEGRGCKVMRLWRAFSWPA